ncbi:MAG: single-stranded-DNA-specific exonuclease RecJ [Alphaproteobacteria bacterium]|jgi:single-stranded-DNA-specific exonuclease|nr:single-stranded-DNA-specific exonuclease RecJ [Alphaproteobacteria bacterium]
MSLSVLKQKWEFKEASERDVLHLSQVKGIDANIASLLVSRGITVDNYDKFINPTLKDQMPDPYTLKDCEKACKIICDSIEKKEKIVIYGDYDVDGGTATSVFINFLKQLDTNVDFYIPNKLNEGYGPNAEVFKRLEKDTDLIVTVDCGTSAFDVIDNTNIKVVITDHHMAEERLPKAEAIVNPKRLDDNSGLDGIAGVAVAFLVCVAVNRELENRGYFTNREKPNLVYLLDLVALGTICDVMKLVDINRVFVSQGLKILNKQSNCGLKALIDLLDINKKIDTYHLGYVFGPRINAGGRLGESFLATKLMTSKNYNEAFEIAKKLNSLNEDRKEIESRIHEEALAYLSDEIENRELKSNLSFVYNPDWHSGVLGIVASRLKEKFNKPSFVLCCEKGVAYGSGRSVSGVDIGAIVVLGKQKGLIKDGGGHKMAAGFSCDIDRIEEVKNFISKQIAKATEGKEIVKTLKIDSVISIKGANKDLIEAIDLMSPFGNGNPQPRFCFQELKIAKTIVLAGKHIKCFLSSPYTKGTLEAIAFNVIDTKIGDFLLDRSNNPISVVGTLNTNSWNGRETIQLIIEDAK